MENSIITELEVIKHLHGWIDNKKFPFQLPRAFMYGWECDFWCMTQGGETREFEIKISRSDFLVDAKKAKHSNHDKGANYFYYVCPKDLIKKEEINKKYGLIYVWDRRIELVKKPQRLHNSMFEGWKQLANKMFWKWYSLWREKYISKEITFDEYQAGFFNTELLDAETDSQ